VDSKFTLPILQAALFLLLSAAVLPDSYGQISADDAYLTAPFSSSLGNQGDALGKLDGDDQKINRIPDGVIVPPVLAYTTSSLNPAPEPDFAFTVSQARAPPTL
jgi:hypothetical protein